MASTRSGTVYIDPVGVLASIPVVAQPAPATLFHVPVDCAHRRLVTDFASHGIGVAPGGPGTQRSFWGSGVPCSPLRLSIYHLGKDANPFAGENWSLVERVVSLTPCLTVAGFTFSQSRIVATDGRKPARSRFDLSPTRKRANHASLHTARPGFAISP